MAKLRRFRVDSLENAVPGAILNLPDSEAAHVRVLRLESGAQLEVFDSSGRSAICSLIAAKEAQVKVVSIEKAAAKKARLILATAWPKGKRAAVMVEKCAELGLDVLIPVRY